MPYARLAGLVNLQMRYFFLKYTKYSCEKVPFCNLISLGNPLVLHCAALPWKESGNTDASHFSP